MLKNILLIFATAFILIGILTGSARAQKRIEFAKGKSSAVVKGNTGTTGVYYNIRAKSGQKIILTLTPVSKVGIKVETDGEDGQEVLLREEKGGTYEVYLEKSGDLSIFLGSTNGKLIPFTLTVKITKMTDI